MNEPSYSVYIVDDNISCIERLSSDIKTYPKFHLLGYGTSLLSVISEIKNLHIDLLFLDIEMPDGNGFDFLKLIAPEHPDMKVVFYSAFDSYAIKALRASAFDFLLKPYTSKELSDILERFEEHYIKVSHRVLSDMDSVADKRGKFALRTISKIVLVKPLDIFCFNYCNDTQYWSAMLVTDNQEIRLAKQTTSKTLLSKGDRFVQVNQNCIVNIDYLYSIENQTLECHFAPPFQDYKIIASRRCYYKIKEQFEII